MSQNSFLSESLVGVLEKQKGSNCSAFSNEPLALCTDFKNPETNKCVYSLLVFANKRSGRQLLRNFHKISNWDQNHFSLGLALKTSLYFCTFVEYLTISRQFLPSAPRSYTTRSARRRRINHPYPPSCGLPSSGSGIPSGLKGFP